MLKKRRQKRRRLKMIKLALSFQRYNERKLKHRSQALASYYLLLNTINHSEMIKESVQANVTNEVRNQVPKLLPRAVSDFILPRMESNIRDVLQKNLIYLAQPFSTPTVSF
ncbi:hypothetical protein Tco_1185046 [Tanacetum coccineum]